MDLIEVLYRFGRDVVDALNNNNVKPPSQVFGEQWGGGVFVMAMDDTNRRQPPLAGSLNYDKDTGKWLWTDQLEQAKPIALEDEQG